MLATSEGTLLLQWQLPHSLQLADTLCLPLLCCCLMCAAV